MKKFRKPLLFALAMLPIALISGLFVTIYQFDMLDPALVEDAIAQIGSKEALIAISVAQSGIYAAISAFSGYILASKLGLMRHFRLERRPLCITIFASVIGGIIFSLDPWVFGRWIPEIDVSSVSLSFTRLIASVLYGGVIEELILRLFALSLIAFVIWKTVYRRHAAAPEKAIIAANIVAALLFAAGHLPSTIALMGELNFVILLRCFLLNGSFGLLFGRLYRKHGIQYAMLSHATFHIISQLIWYIFI